MAMITMNASPETKNPNGELHSPSDTHHPNGIHFVKEPVGLVREIILELLEQRDAKKKAMKQFKKGTPEYDLLDQQQNVLKIIMNTYYGVSGYARFRLFDNEIAFLGNTLLYELFLLSGSRIFNK
jgi:DNA polymerase I